MRRPALIFVLFVLLPTCHRRAVASDALTFEQDVRSILKQQCFHCHGEDPELPGGLDLRLVHLMKTGGDSGPAIVPGDAQSSLLWERIASDEMPEGSKKLSAEQKAIIHRWIEQGATTARPEPASPEAAKFTQEELSHWAYQPVVLPKVPQSGLESCSPIDEFIAERLIHHELQFSPSADRRTLIRRATFDLHGLPPTPAEVDQFLSDNLPDAYERLIDRLLASPQFGVRWARHWLDVAGFAESDGGESGSVVREHAWRYRDYVIRCLNENKPIDQFFVEQLAGDELIDGPINSDNQRHRELLTATGFLRMAPDATQTSNTLIDRNTTVADVMKVVSSAMLGITLGCAQCHDHKYDPIGIDDYYRFRAVFDPLFPLRSWQQPQARLVDFTPADAKAEADRIEAECQKLEEELKNRRLEHAQKIFAAKLADVPDEDREATKLAAATDVANQTDDQKALLKLYPMVKPVSFIAGFLVEYDPGANSKFQKAASEIARLRGEKPPPVKVMAALEQPGVVPDSRIFFRGNPDSPAGNISPGEISVLARHDKRFKVPIDDVDLPSTGRRLAYAKYLTNGKHPLAARVFVNRVWQHHFGRGLVATPNDFGISGEQPSHPKLLDWLAADFVASGWNQKRLHRAIMMSATYRQSSRQRPNQQLIDPENVLLARMNLRRLDAESTRDAIMYVAGQLADATTGPSVPVTADQEGKIVIGKRQERNGLQTGVDGTSASDSRRSIFVQARRDQQLNMLQTFDQPEMNPNCGLRPETTVATQALWFLNDGNIVELSQHLARRAFQQKVDDTTRIRFVFRLLFAAEPSAVELHACRAFLQEQQQHFVDAAQPQQQSLAVLCQTLCASNRFLYID